MQLELGIQSLFKFLKETMGKVGKDFFFASLRMFLAKKRFGDLIVVEKIFTI